MSQTSSSVIDPSTRQAILQLSFATFASMTIQRLCDPMLPELSQTFQVSRSQAAQVISYFAVTYGLMQIFFGPLGDKYGKYKVLAWATVGCSVGCFGSAFAYDLPFLIFCRILTATCTAAIIPLGLAWVGDTVDYTIRQATLARVGLGSTMGIVAGQLFGGLITDTLGWRWAFGLVGGLFFGVGCVLLRNPIAKLQTQPSAGPQAEERLSFFANTAYVFTKQRPRRILACICLEGAFAFGALAISATHLHDHHALAVAWAGAIVSLFGVGGVSYMVLAPRLIARLGESGLVRTGAMTFGLSYALVGFSTHWIFDLVAFVGAGFGFFMFHNTMQVHATQMAPEVRGTCMALFAAILFAGQSVGVIVCAALTAYISSSWVLLLMGLSLAVLGWILPDWIGPDNTKPSGA
jgi:predicted MFS family arabinose efflux permease